MWVRMGAVHTGSFMNAFASHVGYVQGHPNARVPGALLRRCKVFDLPRARGPRGQQNASLEPRASLKVRFTLSRMNRREHSFTPPRARKGGSTPPPGA